jgi:hypothetical protein
MNPYYSDQSLLDRDGEVWWRCPGEYGKPRCDMFMNDRHEHLPISTLETERGPLTPTETRYRRSAMTAARISADGLYRYALLRRWKDDGGFVTFVMLNPSTADATVDDPTIRRCVGFAKAWGYGAVHVLNLFAYRATDPKELTRVADPIGPENDTYLARHGVDSGLMVAAWGSHKMARPRAYDLTRRLHARWHCLGTTKDGSPRHPLYVAAATQPVKWAMS